jgi:putative sterol carrier protein
MSGLGRLVRKSAVDALEQLMHTPARRVVLGTIFWQMPRRFDRERAKGMNSSIQWRITGGHDGREDVYQLDIADGECRVTRNPDGPTPGVTITIDGADFVQVATGSSDPMKAYFSGRVGLAGDVMLAAKLRTLFRVPGRGSPQ